MKRASRRPNGSSAATRAGRLPGWVRGLALTLPLWWGCAPALVRLPTGPGEAAPGYQADLQQATAACRDVRVMTAEVSAQGTVGRQHLRGHLIVGLERPDRLRLEAVAPFGQPAFVLVARDGRATLLLPRDRRVLRDADPPAVLEALAGVTLSPADLLAALSGCGAQALASVSGRAYGHDWLRIDLRGGAEVYLHREHDRWRLVSALPATGGRRQLRIDYTAFQGDRPRAVRLTVAGAGVDLRLQLSQVDLNVQVSPRAFQVDVPAGTEPITLEELRQVSPMGGPGAGRDDGPSR